jgi:hypothetical protein
MPLVCSRHVRASGWRATALAVLACAITAGCTTPPGSSWASFRSRREIEKIADDDSFPTAAEIGLMTSDASSTVGP